MGFSLPLVWMKKRLSALWSGLTMHTILRWPLLPGGVAALLMAIALQWGVLYPIEQLAYVGLFRIRGPIPWSEQIVVIEIDEATLDALSQFPLARHHYARLLNQLEAAEPTAIAFDILFAEASEDDPAFADAVFSQGQVVLAHAWDINTSPIYPTDVLNQAALMTGHILRDDDPDGIARRVRLYAGEDPALSIAALHVHRLTHNPDIELPFSHRTQWINWPGSAHLAPHYSFIDVIRGDIPTYTFRDKIVLVGLTATGQDPLKTPYNWNPPTSGVYFHAAVLSNVLEANVLHPLGHSKTSLVLLFFLGGPGLAGLLSHWIFGRQWLTWLGLGVLWGCLSILLFHRYYWIPTTTPILLFALTGGLVAASEQWRIYLKLRQSEERYALAVTGSNEGIWDWDLTSNTLYVSPRWRMMVGALDSSSKQSSSNDETRHTIDQWFSRIHPDDRSNFNAAITAHLDGQTTFLEHEHRLLHDDGGVRWMLTRGVATWNRQGIPIRMAGSQTDITRRKDVETQLVQQAFYDSLTQLPNRTLFLSRLQETIASDQHSNDLITVFLIDIDRFQLINNSLGNKWGDRLLLDIVDRFQSHLGATDVIARLGGDEYAILSTRLQSYEAVTTFAQTLQDSLAEPFHLNHRDVFVSISMGIVLNSRYYDQPEHWLRDADTALSNAKALGKQCYKLFHNRMRMVLLNRLELENDLRQVLSQPHCPGLVLNYQPIVYLKTGKIISFEALVRWQHPDHGLISPGRFIPMAEETGLIVPLGEWVLRTACVQMKQWTTQFPTKSPFTMSVNLASKQCSLPDLPGLIHSILKDTQLAASYLKLELTESSIMENAESLVDMLHQLRHLGIQLAIDDFGTGYSSLSYLRRFPVNNLKIDQSFVKNMENEADSFKIIQTIVDLAHSLGIDVTAEGLEKLEHSTQLQRLQCEYGQGYFFSKPVDAIAATRLLENEQRNVA